MDGVRGHGLLLPFPAQGHITPLMQLAKILIDNRIVVTFVNTDFIQQRLNHTSTQYLRFEIFPDDLPPDHDRTLKLPELCESLQKHAPFHVENIVKKLMQSVRVPPLTIIVADGKFSFAQQIADKFSVPRVAFWTTSACGFSASYYKPPLIHRGYIPLKGKVILSSSWNMIEDTGDRGTKDPINLATIYSRIYALIIEYSKYHIEAKMSDTSKRTVDLKKWVREAVAGDKDTLFQLMQAANYLSIQSLLDLTYRIVAEDIAVSKHPEMTRQKFNIENDFDS